MAFISGTFVSFVFSVKFCCATVPLIAPATEEGASDGATSADGEPSRGTGGERGGGDIVAVSFVTAEGCSTYGFS